MTTKANLISPRRAAILLDLSQLAVYDALRMGRLKGHKVDGRWVIEPADLEEFRKASRWTRKN